MATTQIDDDSSAARLSILARLAPVCSCCIVLIGAAFCALLLMNMLKAMSFAEAAGVGVVAGGMAEANLAMTIALYLGLVVGFIGVVIMTIRAFTTTTTSSPSSWFLAIIAVLTVVPIVFLWEAQFFFLEGISGRNISLAAPNILLFLRLTIGTCLASAPILLVASFIPLPPIFHAKHKWAPVIFLVLIEVAMIGAAVVFQMRTSWLHRASVTEQL